MISKIKGPVWCAGPNELTDGDDIVSLVASEQNIENLIRRQGVIAISVLPTVEECFRVFNSAQKCGLQTVEGLKKLSTLKGFGGTGAAFKNYRLAADLSRADEYTCWSDGPRQYTAVEHGSMRKDVDFSVSRLSHDQYFKIWGSRDLAAVTRIWNKHTFGDEMWGAMQESERVVHCRDINHFKCEADKSVCKAFLDRPSDRDVGRASKKARHATAARKQSELIL